MAATYYVDFNNGTTGNPGTIGLPFKNVSQFESVYAAGDTCLVRGGVYNLTVPIDIRLQGSLGNVVTIAAYPGEVPDYRLTTSGSNDSILRFKSESYHIVLDGLTLSHNNYGRAWSVASNNGTTADHSHDIVVRNCKAHRIQQRAFGGAGKVITIENCHAYDCGRTNLDGGLCGTSCGGWPGIIAPFTMQAAGLSEDWIVRGCRVEDSWGELVIALRVTRMTIEDNYLVNGYSKSVYVDKAKDVVVRRNVIGFNNPAFQRQGRNVDGVTFAVEGTPLHSPYGVDTVDIYDNLITDCRDDLSWFTDSSNVASTYRNVRFWYNTTSGTTRHGVHIPAVPAGANLPTGNQVSNNIIGGDMTTLNNPTTWTFTNNDWWPDGVPVVGTHTLSFSLDPQFTNENSTPDPSGFRVGYDSPVRNRGVVNASYPADFYGAARPTSGSTTVGFHEAQRLTISPSGTLTPSGALIKRESRALAGTLSFVGAFSASKNIKSIDVTGNLGFSGALTKQPRRALTGVLSLAGGLVRRLSKMLSGTLTSSGTVTSIEPIDVIVVGGTLSFSGTVSLTFIPGPPATGIIQVTIGGTDYAVMSTTRHASLQNPPQTAEIVLRPISGGASTLAPWQDIVIYEYGVKVFTGYVDSVRWSRPPTQTTISASDTFKRARDWFIESNLLANNERVDYWLGYFCDLCDLSYSIHPSVTTGSLVVQKDTPLGLRHVADALAYLSAYAQMQMRVDVDGVLEFLHLGHPSVADYQLDQYTAAEVEMSDEDTRNVIKVWGYAPAMEDPINVSVRRDVDGLSDVDRIGVFAEPSITNLTDAEALANAALDQYASLKRVGRVNILGNPNIIVGTSGSLVVGSDVIFDTITDLRSSIDSRQGYNLDLTLGRRSYRYPYFPVGAEPGTFKDFITPFDGEIKSAKWFDGFLYISGYRALSAGLANRKPRIEKRDHNMELLWFYEPTSQGYAYQSLAVDANGVYVSGVDDGVALVSHLVKVTLDGTFVHDLDWGGPSSFAIFPWQISGDATFLYFTGTTGGIGRKDVGRFTKSNGGLSWGISVGGQIDVAAGSGYAFWRGNVPSTGIHKRNTTNGAFIASLAQANFSTSITLLQIMDMREGALYISGKNTSTNKVNARRIEPSGFTEVWSGDSGHTTSSGTYSICISPRRVYVTDGPWITGFQRELGTMVYDLTVNTGVTLLAIAEAEASYRTIYGCGSKANGAIPLWYIERRDA